MHLLVIEDDTALAQHLCDDLERSGHSTRRASDLASAKTTLLEHVFDVVILDRMLPDGDGLEYLAELRERGESVPVLILSALGDVSDRIEGLRRGSDDYLVKPFDSAELNARLEALARRSGQGAPATRIAVGDLSIDLITRAVSRSGVEVRLQPREFSLLEYLARNAGRVVTRTMLLENVWGLNFDPQTNVVDVHVSRLRSKIDGDFATPLVHTVRGEGYRLAATP